VHLSSCSGAGTKSGFGQVLGEVLSRCCGMRASQLLMLVVVVCGRWGFCCKRKRAHRPQQVHVPAAQYRRDNDGAHAGVQAGLGAAGPAGVAVDAPAHRRGRGGGRGAPLAPPAAPLPPEAVRASLESAAADAHRRGDRRGDGPGEAAPGVGRGAGAAGPSAEHAFSADDFPAPAGAAGGGGGGGAAARWAAAAGGGALVGCARADRQLRPGRLPAPEAGTMHVCMLWRTNLAACRTGLHTHPKSLMADQMTAA